MTIYIIKFEVEKLWHCFCAQKNKGTWWMDGWVGGCQSQIKDCLQQSKYQNGPTEGIGKRFCLPPWVWKIEKFSRDISSASGRTKHCCFFRRGQNPGVLKKTQTHEASVAPFWTHKKLYLLKLTNKLKCPIL